MKSVCVFVHQYLVAFSATFEQDFNGTKIPRWISTKDVNLREQCRGDPSQGDFDGVISDMDCIDRKNGCVPY